MTKQVQPAVAMLGGDYPTSFKEFVGQDLAKRQLITAARSAKKRKVSMPHTLLASGTPGIGKTSLALLVAAEVGAGAMVVSGKMTMYDARMALAEMADGDVLIIDEAHQMVQGSKVNAEWLLHYLQDGVLITPMGPEPQPKVTIIACTTHAGLLPETILNRFRITPMLTGYSEDEATKIAQGMAARVFTGANLPKPSTANCRAIARAASHNPRVIRALLDSVRDQIEVGHEIHQGGHYDLTVALSWLGLTEDGLTAACRAYLTCLLVDFQGQPAGMSAMEKRLQEPGGLGYTERLLQDKGLLGHTPSGRVLTKEGIARTRRLLDT